MNLFSKKLAPPPPTPDEIAKYCLYETVQRLEWTIDSTSDDGVTLLIPKADNIKLRCRLRLEDYCIGSEIDAGIRLALHHVSRELSWAVLYSNGVSRYGTFRVRKDSDHKISLCFGGILSPTELTAEHITNAIRMQSLVFHQFVHLQLKNRNLHFPLDFLGFPTSVIPLRPQY